MAQLNLKVARSHLDIKDVLALYDVLREALVEIRSHDTSIETVPINLDSRHGGRHLPVSFKIIVNGPNEASGRASSRDFASKAVDGGFRSHL
jgi:hypothetical protein